MKILFQGDSVTDSGRDRNPSRPNIGLGTGYVNLIASRIICDEPGYSIYNRAVSGNRIGDMYARWIEDAINIDPDILSIMNGINDVGFSLRLGMGADSEEFKLMYDHMLSLARKANPDISIILIEPFIVKLDLRILTPDTPDQSNDIFLKWNEWSDNIRKRGEIVYDLSKKYSAVFVPLFDEFYSLSEKYGADVWSLDGIHPTPAGHEIIARRWIEKSKDIIKKQK